MESQTSHRTSQKSTDYYSLRISQKIRRLQIEISQWPSVILRVKNQDNLRALHGHPCENENKRFV